MSDLPDTMSSEPMPTTISHPGSMQSIFGAFTEQVVSASVQEPLRLGLLGGTFDPIHIGHLLLAQFAQEQYDLDGVLFIPCAYPFYKTHAQAHTGWTGPANAEARVNMLRLAIQGKGVFELSRVEVDREAPSYTIDTIKTISKACGLTTGSVRVELFLIVGADALVDLPNWRDTDEIARSVTILYGRRPGTDDGQIEHLVGNKEMNAHAVDAVQLDVSSTLIRSRVAKGLSIDYFTPEPVVRYIMDKGLYRQQQNAVRLDHENARVLADDAEGNGLDAQHKPPADHMADQPASAIQTEQ